MFNTKSSKLLAQKIVDAVHEVTQCPINFIDPSGIIIASTNNIRIGEYHQAGYDAINAREPIIVQDNSSYKGSIPGVNYPIFVDEKAFGAIGISGAPEEVNKFGFLSTKVTEIFIKEQQLRKQNDNNAQRVGYFIRSLIYNQINDHQYLHSLQVGFNVSSDTLYSVLVIKNNDVHNLHSNSNMEKYISRIFKKLDVKLHTYVYPNEFIGLMETHKIEQVKHIFEEFSKDNSFDIIAGLGSSCTLHSLHNSYEHAKLALLVTKNLEQNYTFYEDLQLELIFAQLPSETKELFCQHVLGQLDQTEKELLIYYFENGTNLKETAAHFFIHGNTLQYKLDKIAQKTKLNPRVFKDASTLYFALLMNM